MPELPSGPADVAAADQQLVRVTDIVDELTESWRNLPYEPDRFKRIGRFMVIEVEPRLTDWGAYCAVAVAIERLALL